eukprot:Clim_evm5s134 gene=Clim_evmTU5s134
MYSLIAFAFFGSAAAMKLLDCKQTSPCMIVRRGRQEHHIYEDFNCTHKKGCEILVPSYNQHPTTVYTCPYGAVCDLQPDYNNGGVGMEICTDPKDLKTCDFNIPESETVGCSDTRPCLIQKITDEELHEGETITCPVEFGCPMIMPDFARTQELHVTCPYGATCGLVNNHVTRNYAIEIRHTVINHHGEHARKCHYIDQV